VRWAFLRLMLILKSHHMCVAAPPRVQPLPSYLSLFTAALGSEIEIMEEKVAACGSAMWLTGPQPSRCHSGSVRLSHGSAWPFTSVTCCTPDQPQQTKVNAMRLMRLTGSGHLHEHGRIRSCPRSSSL
jgi:hypothetical protein